MSGRKVMREELLALLEGGNAHMTFQEAAVPFPVDAINARLPRVGYTIWQLLEHMRLVQKDILDFVREPGYVSPPYPEGFWPAKEAQASEADWQASVSGFQADLEAVRGLVATADDLLAPLPHAPGYTLFREVLLVADHNAYHVGELVTLRQIMDIPPSGQW